MSDKKRPLSIVEHQFTFGEFSYSPDREVLKKMLECDPLWPEKDPRLSLLGKHRSKMAEEFEITHGIATELGLFKKKRKTSVTMDDVVAWGSKDLDKNT